MGEVKNVNENVVEFPTTAVKPAEVRKEPTAEEWKQMAIQARQQAEKFYTELQRANYSNAFTRMQMLFEVIQSADKFNTNFVTKCAEEIEKFLTIEEDTDVTPD